MTVRLDERLYLVVPLTRDDGTTVYIHAAPLSREVFEAHFRVLGSTFAKIVGQGKGYAVFAGMRNASLELKQTARELGVWDAVSIGLVAEIRRLTNVLSPGDEGWKLTPFEAALKQGIISEDEFFEAENEITFFILLSAHQKKTVLRDYLKWACDLWEASITLFSVTEFRGSLPTSTPAVASPTLAATTQEPSERAAVSSVPY